MASIRRSAEQVECCDELITDILSRVSTRDVPRMSTVSKRWRTLIFDPDFVHTHCKNRHRELILCLMDIHWIRDFRSMDIHTLRDFRSIQYEFRSFNSQSGFSVSQKRRYTLVFDSHSNSWYEGPPLLIDLSDYNFRRAHLFFNGVIYFVGRVKNIGDQELIIGYDVNQDQWGFSVSIPSTVGSVYCLTEWKGNLLVCAASSDGLFVLWILDTEHKLWIRERDLDLSHRVRTSWKVSASGGVVWFASGYNFVTVYHMKNRQYLIHRLDDAFPLLQEKYTSFVSFEPTLLSF